MVNVWHDISKDRINPDQFTAFIEISKGSKMKYELDKATGMLKADRVMSTSTQYPWNYGLIPRTLAPDHDPLDVLVICSEPIMSNTLVECIPIGVMKMKDGGDQDDKIIGVFPSDMTYNTIHDYRDMPKHLFDLSSTDDSDFGRI
jgi:inorganic pyrophosphatase